MREWLIEWRTVERQGPDTPYIACPLECMGQGGKNLFLHEPRSGDVGQQATSHPFLLHCSPFLLFPLA